jgi:hypothetical protein
MDDELLLKLALGAVIALIGGVLVHLHLRVLAIETQIADVIRTMREEVNRDIKELWAARDRDRDQRERDLAASTEFRERILLLLSSMATKGDVKELGVRIDGAVRMVINDFMRKDET